jgi:AraC family transcriptional regulator
LEIRQADRLMRLRRYINQNLDKELDRKALAMVSGVSVSHLHRVFRAGHGESLAGYVRRVRLVRAGQKLRMGAVDISEVALAAGYHTHAAFGKAFKQQFGLSPSDFRQLDCWTATRMLRLSTGVNANEDHSDKRLD